MKTFHGNYLGCCVFFGKLWHSPTPDWDFEEKKKKLVLCKLLTNTLCISLDNTIKLCGKRYWNFARALDVRFYHRIPFVHSVHIHLINTQCVFSGGQVNWLKRSVRQYNEWTSLCGYKYLFNDAHVPLAMRAQCYDDSRIGGKCEIVRQQRQNV